MERSDFLTKCNSVLQRYKQEIIEFDFLKRQSVDYVERESRLNSVIEKHVKAIDTIRLVSEKMLLKFKVFIENILRQCLTAVFKKNYDVNIKVKLYQNRLNCSLELEKEKDGKTRKINPAFCGGSVNDVLNILLKVLLVVFGTRFKVVMIDEGFKFLHRSAAINFLKFLKKISIMFGIQFIFIWNDDELIFSEGKNIFDQIFLVKHDIEKAEASVQQIL